MNTVDTTQYSQIVQQVLRNRRLVPQEYMTTATRGFPDYVFPNLHKGRNAVIEAMKKDQHIVVWGDFDADGISSTAVLVDTFRLLHYPHVSYHIPSRFDSNHGLNIPGLEKIALEHPGALVITCDNGTNDVEQVDRGNECGLEFIITDHHEQTGPIPNCLAHINPSSHPLDSPYRGLVGVGVAYVFCRSLLINHGLSHMTKFLLDLVAIGTIADVAPNSLLNRSLLFHGCPILWSGQRIGLRTLIKLNDIRTFMYNTEEISFKIGPMLNAAGRMATADIGVNLLLAPDQKTATYYAHTLKILNQERQIAMAEMENRLESMLPENTKEIDGLVIVGQDLHPGLIGLTAGKLARRFFKPSIVITSLPGFPDVLRGSCRTSEGVHILSVLETQKDLLLQYGGHAGAAGFTISRENIDDFMVGFLSSINQFKKFDASPTFYDIEINWGELDITYSKNGTVAQIESLAPFTEGHPMPLLMSRNVFITKCKIIGDLKNHAVLQISDGKREYEAYYWRFDAKFLKSIGVDLEDGSVYNPMSEEAQSTPIDIIYSVSRSFFIKQSIRIQIESMRHSFQKTKS